MRRLLLGSAFLALMCGASLAGEVTLCAGAKGKNYDAVMKGIGNELANRGHQVAIRNLAGSEDILKQLDAGACDYGPAQGDIYYKLSKDGSLDITPKDVLYNEVAILVCAKSSKVDELEDLGKKHVVITDSIGSGSALTWDILKSIEKEFGNSSSWIQATTSYVPLTDAGAAIRLKQATCAFGVGATNSKWARDLVSEGNVVAWIYDKDINDLLVNDDPLYHPVRVPKGDGMPKFDTYAVPAVIFSSNKSAAAKDADISDIVKRSAPSIGQKFNTVQID